MFTKKLALVGFAAGLAALSMSCSNDSSEGSDAFDISVSIGPNGSITLSGEIKAAEGDKINEVKVAVNGSDVDFDIEPTLGQTVSLNGISLVDVCDAIKSSEKEEVKVKVTAKFDKAGTIHSSEKKIELDCRPAP